MHVGVGLDDHELIDPHGAGLAHATEIVALQVDEHDVLGALLGMGRKLAHLALRHPRDGGCAAGCRRWDGYRPRAR